MTTSNKPVIQSRYISVAVLLGAAAFSLHCSGIDLNDLSFSSKTQHQLSPEQSRIMGFETPLADWSANNSSSLTASPDAIEGVSALAIQPAGYTEVSSIALDAPGSAYDSVSVDLKLPDSVSWGTIGMRVVSPQSGVYYAGLGTINLVGTSPGSYQKVVFDVPPEASAAFTGDADDLVFTVILNHSPLTEPVLLDNLAFGVPDPEFHFESKRIALTLPSGVDVDDSFIAASNLLIMDDGTTLGKSGESPIISNLGKAGTEVGANVSVYADVKSRGSIEFLRPNSQVFGDIVTSGRVLEQNNVNVSGSISEYTPIAGQETSWTVEWPVGGGEQIQLNSGGQRALTPGLYGDVNASSQTLLAFSSGTYFLSTLNVDSSAVVSLDTTDGPIIVYVRGSLRLMSPFGVDPTKLIIVHAGSSAVEIGEVFRGTLVAPNATVNLRRPPSEQTYKGSFFASGIHLDSDSSVEFAPFDFSVLCSSTPGSCLGRQPKPPTSNIELELAFPKGSDRSRIALATRHGLSSVNSTYGKTGGLVTVAEGTASINDTNVSGTVVATNGGAIGAGSSVQEDLISEVPFIIDPGASLGGTEISNAQLNPIVKIPLSITFPKPTDGNITVGQGEQKILTPGHYEDLILSTGGEVYLRSGRYQFSTVTIEAGASLKIPSTDGRVVIEVSDALSALGTVVSPGKDGASLQVVYAGLDVADVAGAFSGSLLAPRAKIEITGGAHDAFFYGDEVALSGGVVVTHTFDGTPDIVAEDPPIFTDWKSDEEGGVISARADKPGVYVDAGGFDFEIPEDLPVSAGNAGNHGADVAITKLDGSTVTCSYLGGAASAHPTTFVELAKGLKYVFGSCTDGYTPGSVLIATEIEITLTGDSNAAVPNTGVNLGFGDTCDHDLEQPIDPVTSRQMIENFSWANATPVAERDANGDVALYYANIYFENANDVSKAQRLLIHYQSLPFFAEEMTKYAGKCGSVDLSGDGEGIFVFSVIPGAIYNKLIAALSETDIPGDEREVFRAVILRAPPAGTVDANGALRNDALRGSGFRYLDLNELPPDGAVNELVYGDKVTSAILDAIEWIGEATKDIVREAVVGLGTYDKWINGSHRVEVDLDVSNLDLNFPTEDDAVARFANTRFMEGGWGDGGELAPDHIQATLYTLSTHPSTLWTPIPTASKGKLDDGAGGVTLEVPNAASGQVDFLGLCYEMVNDYARITPFITNAITCNFTLTNQDFNEFKNEDIGVRVGLKNKNLAAMSEFTDSATYVHNVVGLTPWKASILTGPWAHVMSPGGVAWASCLALDSRVGTANLVADSIFTSATALAPLVGTALEVLATNDIYLPFTKGNFSRGVPTHEYGHFALCQLSKDQSGKILEPTTKTFDVLGALGGVTADTESRTINEAFADFFAYQVVGGVNYYDLWSANSSVVDGYVEINHSDPGLDRNDTLSNWDNWHTAQNRGTATPGALARMNWYGSILQDLFDGQPGAGLVPTNGDRWDIDSSGLLVPGTTPTTYFDREGVVLPGSDLITFADEFFKATPNSGAYRYDALDEAIVKTLERTNVSWCNKCLMLIDNYVAFSSPSDIRERMMSCLTGEVGGKIGAPPLPVEQMNAFTCSACPPGRGMGVDGTCSDCGADLVVDWETFDGCDGTIDFPATSSATDVCPDEFVVDIVNIQSTSEKLKRVDVGPTSEPSASDCSSTGYDLALQAGAMFSPLPIPVTQSGVGVPGAPCDTNFCIYDPCTYPGLSGVDVAGADRVRVSASVTQGNVPLSILAIQPECVIR